MEGKIALALILFVCAKMTYGYPAAQLIPIRTIVSPYQYQSTQGRGSFMVQPQQHQQPFNFVSAEPTCPCALRGESCPNCARTVVQEPMELAIGEIDIPQRVVRSIPVSSLSVDDDDSAFMKVVRSALIAMEPLFGSGELQVLSPQPKSAQREMPIDNLLAPAMPISDTRSQKVRLDSSPAQGYGMYYSNVRVQSLNANSDECGKVSRAKSEERQASKERKFDEEHGQIMDALEQLSQGQIATMMAQLDTEMMTEQEFHLIESYLREIKRQMNSLRATGEAKDRVTNVATATPSSVATVEKEKSDSQTETTTAIDETPDTTPSAPVELQSTASTESVIAEERNGARRI